MKVILDGDLIVGRFNGDGEGVEIPVELLAFDDAVLRFDGEKIIDASDITDWVIDLSGRKRLPAMHPGSDWQEIDCAFDADLISENDVWRVKTDADELVSAKAATMLAIVAAANQFTAPILAKYPTAETSGWSLKQAESEAIIAAADAGSSIPDAVAETMIMKTLASGNNWDDAEVETAARAVVAKVEQFASISAMVEIMRTQSVTAVEAANNLEELEATKTQLMQTATALAVKYGLA